MRKLVPLMFLLLVVILLSSEPGTVALAQGECGDAPAPRLIVGQSGQVLFTDGQPLNVRDAAGLNAARVAELPEGSSFLVLEGPVCADSIYWWRVQVNLIAGWIAEGLSSEYFVEPVAGQPTEAIVPTAPPAQPVDISGPGSFVNWDWEVFLAQANSEEGPPDPMTIVPPAVYAGDLPALPVDLSQTRFVEDAGLNDAEIALLAQNGFVVTPGGFDYFDDPYRDDNTWSIVPEDYDFSAQDPVLTDIGHGYFVTTDSMLWALHYIFDNLLTDLEQTMFVETLTRVTEGSLLAAYEQANEARGTDLERPARNAALYLTVAVLLLDRGQAHSYASDDLINEAAPIVEMIRAGEGQAEIPFLPGYLEDFSQYRPRGHYADDPMLEAYFRGMMWLSRITFLANDTVSTQTALLLLRALRTGTAEDLIQPNLGFGMTGNAHARPRQQGPATVSAYDLWLRLHEVITFMIGPSDDLGPLEYGSLADQVFGADLPLASLADPALLAQFGEGVAALPAPLINGMIVPDDTTAEELGEITRGFRFMGQRFTLDGYVLGQLIYPYVGTIEQPRPLPLGLDVAAAFGSDTAYDLAVEAGAADFANYDTQVNTLRDQTSAMTPQDYLENIYGGWLWTLQPLWMRDNPAAYPPMMLTEAWLRRDLQAGLASWTTLKHDTVLYIKQPTGFGGGGPPLASFGYVEPNPLVFARIAVVSAMLHQGLVDRGFINADPNYYFSGGGSEMQGLFTDDQALQGLTFTAARFAEVARMELAGEPLTEDIYWSILGYGNYLNILLRTLYQGEGEPDPVALVTDVASNPSAGTVLQEGVGAVDYIYVVVPDTMGGYQVVRGGVFSYYEFIGDINQRMTDDEWRALVESGETPPRPGWVSAFMSE